MKTDFFKKFAAMFSVCVMAWSYTGNIAVAGEVVIKAVKAKKTQDGLYNFTVTLEHADEGWDHYADAWRIVDEQGNVHGLRTLHHPHVEEQPFTRSLSAVSLPEELMAVYIEAHDNVHGWTKEKIHFELSEAD